jgi:hypothetical protein
VLDTLVPEETKVVDGITFNLKRYLKDGHIIKEIAFGGQGLSFFRKVKHSPFKILKLMEEAGIYLLDIF